MILAIQDANILIDLVTTGILDSYFQLNVETVTTDLVLREIHPEQRELINAYVASGKLKVVKFTDTALAHLIDFQRKRSSGLSLQDCSVFQIALERKAMLLTGDGTLRKKAEHENVKVCGILWIFDQLVESGIWKKSVARVHLQTLMKKNTRLPQDECNKRLKQWE
ncbi:MAG: hypothetical protein ACK4UN_10845 [Limisphaerales bacterium]